MVSVQAIVVRSPELDAAVRPFAPSGKEFVDQAPGWVRLGSQPRINWWHASCSRRVQGCDVSVSYTDCDKATFDRSHTAITTSLQVLPGRG